MLFRSSSRCLLFVRRRRRGPDSLHQGFAVVWIEIRGFSPQEYGLTYISLGLGFVGACVLLATFGSEPSLLLQGDLADGFADRFYMHYIAQAKAAGTKTQPEARLGLTYFGAILAPVYVLVFLARGSLAKKLFAGRSSSSHGLRPFQACTGSSLASRNSSLECRCSAFSLASWVYFSRASSQRLTALADPVLDRRL